MTKLSDDKQTFWLNHIKQARENKIPLARYAHEAQISEKSIYRWKNVLKQRGLLPTEKCTTGFAKVKAAPNKTKKDVPVEIHFSNGHRLQLNTVEQSTLISLVATLKET